MYFGEAVSKLDEKGRITVPRRIRDTMNGLGHAIWYLTRGYDGCLFMFPHPAWDQLREKAGRFQSIDTRALDFKRLFFSSVAESRPDPQGRMAIPQHLREYARIDKEAVVIGVDDHLELWSKEVWQEFVAAREPTFREMSVPVIERGPAEAEHSEEEKGADHGSDRSDG